MTEPHRTDSPEGGDAPLGEEPAPQGTEAEAEDAAGIRDLGEEPQERETSREEQHEGDASLEEELEQLVRKDIETLTKERDDYLDSLQRLQADFDNYRKRALRQQTDVLERASEQLVVQLLPVLDALDLAEAHGGEGDKEGGALSQIGTLLRGTLEREGLERIDAVGVAFDPNEHDAVAHEEAGEDATSGPQVTEVMRAGYRLKGRILRPAMVKVMG
jgi:molecular chaperone GrpE